ncbi:hypothetical protein WNY58_02210 [Neptuniibacter pectenicola]|uniref:Uncharacterized protein n=1 Tax=Neptuniibacter pectenicola TaxID=1806669 RepID=A0ABU9TN89_9GAMM|nr:hypothetical protein [Neptuniibacter pectenicola]
MNNESEMSVRLNACGDVDTAYYIALAHKQRGEVFAGAFRAVAASVKALLRSSHSNRLSVPTYTY